MMSYVSDENLPSGHSGGDKTSTAHTICSRYYLPKLEPEYHHHTTVVSFDHINHPSPAMRDFHHTDASFFRIFSSST